MKKRTLTILIISLSLITIALVGTMLNIETITGAFAGTPNELNIHSFTKAICENGYCQDFEFTCNGKEIISQKPVTDLIPLSDNWKDPRTIEQINLTCGFNSS